MTIIATAATLAHVLSTGCDPGLAPILQRYQSIMCDEELAVLYIMDLGDRSKELEASRGRPFEHWEFITLEAGWFEAVFVLDDYGHGHVVLIPDSNDCDPELLTICREHAVTNG